MHWRSYLTWAAFRLGAHHTPSDYWGQGSYPMGYWHGQRDKWRCLSGAIWQYNSSYLLLVLKGRVKRNTILYLAGPACAFQIRGMFGCTTSWKSALKMILRDICWFCDLSSMQLWFPAAVSLGKSSLNCGLESASTFFFFYRIWKQTFPNLILYVRYVFLAVAFSIWYMA